MEVCTHWCGINVPPVCWFAAELASSRKNLSGSLISYYRHKLFVFQAKSWELPFEKIYLQGNYVQPEFELYLQSWNFFQNLFLQIDSMIFMYKNYFRTFFITLCISTVKFDIKKPLQSKKMIKNSNLYSSIVTNLYLIHHFVKKKRSYEHSTNSTTFKPLILKI